MKAAFLSRAALPVAAMCLLLTVLIAVLVGSPSHTAVDLSAQQADVNMPKDLNSSRSLSSDATSVASGAALGIVSSSLNALLKRDVSVEPAALQLPIASVPVPLPSTNSAPVGGSEEPSPMTLSVIVSSQSKRSAIIDGRLVHVGDKLDAGTVVAITNSQVRIKQGDALRVLTVRSPNTLGVADIQEGVKQ